MPSEDKTYQTVLKISEPDILAFSAPQLCKNFEAKHNSLFRKCRKRPKEQKEKKSLKIL